MEGFALSETFFAKEKKDGFCVEWIFIFTCGGEERSLLFTNYCFLLQ